MIQANQWSLTDHPRSTLWGKQPMAWRIEAGGLLVGLSAHLGFLPPLGVGHKHAYLWGRGVWLAPSYNWMRTYGQSDPLGVREDNISRASPIKTILAWHEFIHTMAMP